MRDCSWVFNPREGFKNIRPNNFKCCSDRTDHLPNWGYNCIAWAVGKTDNWWWPSGDPTDYWPIPLDNNDPEGLEQFIKAFKTEGYDKCDDPSFENGYEKIALYMDGDEPLHAARQLPHGTWTSKLGRMEDIEHDSLEVIEGSGYGKAKIFFRKPNAIFKKPSKLRNLFQQLARKLFPGSFSPQPNARPPLLNQSIVIPI